MKKNAVSSVGREDTLADGYDSLHVRTFVPSEIQLVPSPLYLKRGLGENDFRERTPACGTSAERTGVPVTSGGECLCVHAAAVSSGTAVGRAYRAFSQR